MTFQEAYTPKTNLDITNPPQGDLIQPINIGIDVDGVLRALFPYCNQKFFEQFPLLKQYEIPWKDIKSYDTKNWFKPGHHVDIVFRKWVFDSDKTLNLYSSAPIYEHAKSFDKLVSNFKQKFGSKVNIYIVTDQDDYNKRVGTLNWLAKHQITNIDGVFFTSEKHCCGLQYLLDDKLQNVQNVSQSRGTGILMQETYNVNDQHKFKVNSLEGYFNLILEGESKK